jgi:hypothetical protein
MHEEEERVMVDGDYDIRLVTDPNALGPEQAARLTSDFVDVSWRATGGPAWEAYTVAKAGWEKYYADVGNRPEDYNRLALVYYRGRLIHFTGVQVVALDERVRLVWVHVAITDPAHQGKGALALAAKGMFDRRWLGEMPAGTLLVFRTPNPIAYEAMRSLATLVLPNPRWYPNIADDGRAEPVPDDVRDLAVRISSKLSPESRFDPDTFVVHGYYGRYGDLYRQYDFPCRNQSIKRYFDAHVNERAHEGIMVLIRFGGGGGGA